MVRVYKYCVEYWDKSDENTNINTERGVVFASTFSEAVHSLENYYGKNEIESICELKYFNIGDECVLPERVFEVMRRA